MLTVAEHGAGHSRATYEAERFELARRFREKYGSAHESGEQDRANVAPDTVVPRRCVITKRL